MSLIKRYSHPEVIIELRKFRNGYHIIEKRPNRQGDFEEESRYAGVQALDKASNFAYSLVTDTIEEGLDPADFKVWSRH